MAAAQPQAIFTGRAVRVFAEAPAERGQVVKTCLEGNLRHGHIAGQKCLRGSNPFMNQVVIERGMDLLPEQSCEIILVKADVICSLLQGDIVGVVFIDITQKTCELIIIFTLLFCSQCRISRRSFKGFPPDFGKNLQQMVIHGSFPENPCGKIFINDLHQQRINALIDLRVQ